MILLFFLSHCKAWFFGFSTVPWAKVISITLRVLFGVIKFLISLKNGGSFCRSNWFIKESIVDIVQQIWYLISLFQYEQNFTHSPKLRKLYLNICRCGITGILHLKRSNYQPTWIYLLVISLTSENIHKQINNQRIYKVTFNLHLISIWVWIWNTQPKKSIFYIFKLLFLRLLCNLYFKETNFHQHWFSRIWQ